MNGPSAIIIDAGPLIALVNRNDNNHSLCKEVWRSIPAFTKLVMPISALTEAFAILPEGRHVVGAVRDFLSKFRVRMDCIQQHELDRAFDLMVKYADLPMDFADAEIVIVSERLNIRTVFTMDKTDFSVYRPKHVKHYQLIPG